MGDECHNRNAAATSLFARRLASGAGRDRAPTAPPQALDFVGRERSLLPEPLDGRVQGDAGRRPRRPGSTVVTAMARNGVEFGIRVSGTGDSWFTAPADGPDGLYFPGYGPDDANPDLGDSAITETRGIGGFAMAAAPGHRAVRRRHHDDALAYTREMATITLGAQRRLRLPALGFAARRPASTPGAWSRRRSLPVINTGIAHREAGRRPDRRRHRSPPSGVLCRRARGAGAPPRAQKGQRGRRLEKVQMRGGARRQATRGAVSLRGGRGLSGPRGRKFVIVR